MAAGIALSRWFGQEAKRVYGLLAEGQTDEDCRKLVERIECLGGTITAYELKRHARQYRSTDQAEAALQDLADQGFGAWTAVSTAVHGGRPTRTFVLHRVAETPSKHEENGGFRYSNSNTQREQDDDWGGRMTPFSPSATAVLADLQALGIDAKPDGDDLRYRPRQAMTPALLRRLQTHKVELLAMLMIQQVHDLAELMAEAWQERLAICTADGIPLAEAEQTALKQLQAMVRCSAATSRVRGGCSPTCWGGEEIPPAP